jgi:hypothetical protein
MTCIQNSACEPPGEAQTDVVPAVPTGIPSTLATRLSEWADSLPAVMPGFPLTSVMHGYSGHWKAVLELDKWHSKPVVGRNMVGLNYDLLLQIPPNGRNGIGIGTGKLMIRWQSDKRQKELFQAMFLVCSSMSDVTCHMDGSMTFRTESLIRQLAFMSGEGSFESEFSDAMPANWIVGWKLTPRPSDVGLMDVTYSAQVPPNWVRGTGGAFRQHAYFG